LEDGHIWAEYYLENYGWIPVDAIWQLFNALDNKHFSSISSVPGIQYANYFINGTDASRLIDKQTVQLVALQPSAFSDYAFAQNVAAAVERIKEAEIAISIGKLFGASIIFSSKMREFEQNLLNAKILVQNAIDVWETSAQIASSNVFMALENAKEVLRDAWMLTLETFALYLGILLLLMLILLAFTRRHRKVLSEKSGTSHIATITPNLQCNVGSDAEILLKTVRDCWKTQHWKVNIFQRCNASAG